MKQLDKHLARGLMACSLAIITVTTSGTAAATTGSPVSTTLAVSASIADKCTLTTTGISFGAYDPVSGTNLTAGGTVVVSCAKTASTSQWIGLDLGANASSTQRRMKASGSTTVFMNYEIVQPSSFAAGAACPGYAANTPFGNTSITGIQLAASPGKAARTYNVCGQVAGGQDLPVDASYADTINASINF